MKKYWGLFFLSIILITFLMSKPIYASEIQIVTTPEMLIKAFNDPEGSHVKLGNDIIFTTKHATVEDNAVEVLSGTHVLDLNGYTIKYAYIDKYGNNSGLVINVRDAQLTINGTGTVSGGWMGIQASGNRSVLIINGGTYKGNSGAGMRIQQGAVVVNKGTFDGGYRDVFMEDGIFFNQGGTYKTITKVGGAYTSNGKLIGNAQLTTQVTINTLTIPSGTTLRIWDGGILNVTGSVTGKENVKLEHGIFADSGNANALGRVYIKNDLTLNRLVIPSGTELNIQQGSRLTVKNSIRNNGEIRIDETSDLIVTGDIYDNGDVRREGALGGLFYYDVKTTDWYYDFLISLSHSNVISGYENRTYRPKNSVSWGHALALTVKSMYQQNVAPTQTHWASGFMDKAIELNALDQPVDLDRPITRLEMAQLISRFLALEDVSIVSPYEDTADSYAIKIFEAKIMMGTITDNIRLFNPEQHITRAEICAVISNLIDYQMNPQ